jgi:hypothetical protein
MRKIASTIAFGLAFALPMLAQTPAPGGVPLDPVSWVVLAAGAGIAGKKYMDSRKKDAE